MVQKLKNSMGLKCIKACIMGCVAGALMLFGIGFFISPVLLSIVGVIWGTVPLIAGIVSFAAFLLLNIEAVSLFPLLLLVAIPAIATAYFLKKHKSFDALMGICGAVLLSLWLYVWLYCALQNINVLTFISVDLPETYASFLGDYGAMTGLDDQAIASLTANAGLAFREMMPSFVLAMAAIIGLLCFIIPGRMAQRRGIATSHVRPFVMWALPRSFVHAILIIFVLGLLGKWAELNGFAGVALAGETLFMLSFGLQGIAVLKFFLSNGNRLIAFFVILIGSIVLGGMPLVMIGVMDNAFKWRKRVVMQAFVHKSQEKNGPKIIIRTQKDDKPADKAETDRKDDQETKKKETKKKENNKD